MSSNNDISLEKLLESAVEASLAPFLDEDVCDYIQQMLSDNPHDEDARQAVEELLRGSIDTASTGGDQDPEDIITAFFDRLTIEGGNNNDTSAAAGTLDTDNADDNNADGQKLKLLEAVTLKDRDVQTFASGLTAELEPVNFELVDPDNPDAGVTEQQSSIASFYANMIDISNNEAVQSERKRRKARQRALREEMEEAERKRALDEAMDVLNNDDNGEDEEKTGEEMLDAANDHGVDVHLKNFDLPNLRGGGPDLLQNQSITLSRGRRYGLMGKNGCGKTTLMTFIAQRQIPDAIPNKMTMLLVRQEIIGNEWTAVETVVKSDVKREGVKRFIKWCEQELERLENGGVAKKDETAEAAQAGTGGDADDTTKKTKGTSKSKQRLLDRKKAKMQKAARAKVNSKTDTSKIKKQSIEEQKTKLSEKLGRAYQKLAQIEEDEGGDPEPRARKVLAGLGFSEEMQNKPTSQLSGGWRMRVSISCALFANPSLLLLDEPTNHLDLESCMFLEQYLSTKFDGTLLVVSHDRNFLNEVITDVLHFHQSKISQYRGDITNFEAVVEEERVRQIRLRENQEAKKAHLQKYIDLHSQAGENGPKAARQRKSKMKKMDKIGVMAQDGKKWKASYDGDAEEVEEYKEEEKIELIFPDPGGFDGSIVTLQQCVFGYTKDKLLLDKVDLNIDLKSRVALLGRNGCGKSTLVKLVVGKLRPLDGEAKIDGRAKIEYLAQHQLEQLDPDGTPIQTMMDRYPGDGSNAHILSLRNHLANFGLGGQILPKQQIHTMSGGQKCRLCLASAMYRKPHLLILDEPTNHLDFETSEALIEGINKFKGGVLLVSHDQHLLTSVCKDLVVVQDGKLDLLRYGNGPKDAFDAYKKDVVLGRR